jgi:hypothetical protein
MKKREQTWDPLEQVGNTVDAMLDSNPRHRTTRTQAMAEGRRSVGRPRVEGRRRLIASVEKEQFKKLRLAAIERDVDISTIVRDALKSAGF